MVSYRLLLRRHQFHIVRPGAQNLRDDHFVEIMTWYSEEIYNQGKVIPFISTITPF